jgi:hypothetical protein
MGDIPEQAAINKELGAWGLCQILYMQSAITESKI